MLSKKIIGATAAKKSLYVDDVASVYLYTGNGSTQTITNNVDLSGEGGLVWIKSRSAATDHQLFDTARGATKELISNSTAAEATDADTLTAFNADGFSLGADSNTNTNAATYCSWSFRKAPKFFDVVTYTGNGASDQTINHNLGSTPGFIIVKATSTTSAWWCYHRGLSTPNNFQIRLSSDAAAGDTGGNAWNVTSTTFNASGSLLGINASSETYVAYLFAHDAGGFGAAGTDNVISCGSFTTDGSNIGTVNLGYEPQYILVKSTSAAEDWIIYDVMRGWSVGTSDRFLRANLSNAEGSFEGGFPTATGFQFTNGSASTTYIYMAIRRPMKPPTSGTEVFAANVQTSPTYEKTFTTGFPVDLAILYDRNTTRDKYWFDRLRGQSASGLESTTTDAEVSYDACDFDLQTTWKETLGFGSSNALVHAFKRATGFFDVVCYTGTGSGSPSLPHNLTVTPELIIVKRRSGVQAWCVFGSALGANTFAFLNLNAAASGGVTFTAATSTTFGAQEDLSLNESGVTYVAYLFSTLAGISKVFSFTGNGSSQTINCGFTAGARLVLIKRTDSTGDWYIWDTARGIVSGNDPHLSLNTTAAEVTSNDSIDPDNSGFVVNQLAATNINVSSATYIGLAIA